MRKKLVLVLGVVALLGLAAPLWGRLQPPRPGVTEANFHRLHRGIIQREAEAILGGAGEPGPQVPSGYSRCWEGEHCDVCLEFSDCLPIASAGQLRTEEGRVEPLPAKPTPFWDQVRSMLPW
jgi:hypothetical protein